MTLMPAQTVAPPLDPWGMLGLPAQIPPASFLTSPNAAQYRLIVRILADQQTHSLTGVSHDDVVRLVREQLRDHDAADLVESMNIDDRLSQLVAWGTCEAWQDKAETEADFLRNRSRYQLTEAGAYLNEVAQRIEAELGLGSTAALMAPGVLADLVEATVDAIQQGDMARANTTYAQVQNTLDVMAQTASAWQSKLAAALGGPPDEAKVTRLMETILAYVDAWGSGVDAYSVRITTAVPILEALPQQTWHRVALARVGSSAPDHTIDEVTNELSGVSATLRRWFCGVSPQAVRLRRQMRDAIAPVLRSHRTLLAVGGTLSRKADLVRLAHAVEAASDQDEAWMIWARATSLYAARHLTRQAPEIDRELRTSMWEAPPVPISARLRAQGHRSLSGRAARIPDLSKARLAARAEAARDRVEQARAEENLVRRSGTSLSAWEPLDATQTELFLDFLSLAREGRDPSGELTGRSTDGRWTIRFTPADPPSTAVIRTPDGRLALTDGVMEIEP